MLTDVRGLHKDYLEESVYLMYRYYIFQRLRWIQVGKKTMLTDMCPVCIKVPAKVLYITK